MELIPMPHIRDSFNAAKQRKSTRGNHPAYLPINIRSPSIYPGVKRKSPGLLALLNPNRGVAARLLSTHLWASDGHEVENRRKHPGPTGNQTKKTGHPGPGKQGAVANMGQSKSRLWTEVSFDSEAVFVLAVLELQMIKRDPVLGCHWPGLAACGRFVSMDLQKRMAAFQPYARAKALPREAPCSHVT